MANTVTTTKDDNSPNSSNTNGVKTDPSNNHNRPLYQASTTHLIRYGGGGTFLPFLATRASGVFVYTADGRRILDFTSGQMSCLIGHGHPEIVATIHEHAGTLDHLFSGMLSPPVLELAGRLRDVLPSPGLEKMMFLSTGGESNEAAIKMAKLYTGKYEVVALGGSWHGMTDAARSVTYHKGRQGYGPMVPGTLYLPSPNAYRSPFRHPDGTYDWETELNYGWSIVDQQSTGSLAAVILEPILSSGGMLVLPPGYMAAMKRHCEQRGMLLIVDEAQTAIGRCGDMFAFQHEDNGVVPDILALSKTLGNGIPLSAVVTSAEIEQRCAERGFLFYTTHVNDPLPAAVGAKVLEIVQRDGLVERSRRLGVRLHARLREFQKKYPCIGDVRGRGLMAGVEIIADRKTRAQGTELGMKLADKMYELGLSANLANMASFGGVLRIAPPITITEEELDLGLGVIEKAFESTPESFLEGK